MAVITPTTFNALNRYVNVRLQQGVPIVDADVNELDDTRKFEVRAFLKWFVGDGVPEGNDGFRIAGTGVANDFTIAAGIAGAVDAVRNIGRAIVDGLDVMIDADVAFRAQPLHTSQAGSAALAARLGVPVVAEMPAPADGTVTAYLDVWERLVTKDEAPGLVLPGLGTESCARVKREWVVRVRNGTSAPVAGDPDFAAGHSYYALATIARRAGDAIVNAADVTDRREQRLLMPPATLISDVFGVAPSAYRRGQGRPPISLRDAINALLHGDLPATPDTTIAPAAGIDFMSYAFNFDNAGGVSAVWHSNRAGGANQVFATRWLVGTPGAATSTPPQQVTTGAQAHALPHAVVLPGGDILVTYETAQQDIHFRRAPLSGLSAAAEQPVAVTAGVAERHPFAVVAGNQVVFFWHQGTPNPRWMYRRRQYPATWLEAGATWVDATGQQLSATDAAPPSLSLGDFHAAADSGGNIWVAFRTAANRIQALRFTPATGATSVPAAVFASGAATDQEPYVVVDGTAAVWIFWRSENGVFYQRSLGVLGVPAWEATATGVPGTSAGTINARPCTVRDGDGALWLFWVTDQTAAGNNDIWLVRRNPLNGLWGQPRQLTGSAGDDNQPVAVIGPNGVVWLFWRSNRTGDYELYFKQIVTAI